MARYSVHVDDGRAIRCQCGRGVFSTPEPVADRFYGGRFVCVECARVWSVENIAQRVTFRELAAAGEVIRGSAA